MEIRPDETDRAKDARDARRFVLLCFVMAMTWIAILLALRALGWLPDEVAAEPHFGHLLAAGMPVVGVIAALFRARAVRAGSVRRRD